MKILFSRHIIRLLFLYCLVSIGNSVCVASSTTNIGKPTNTDINEGKLPINYGKFEEIPVFSKFYITNVYVYYPNQSDDITTKDNVYNFVLKLLSFLKYTCFTSFSTNNLNCDLPFFGDWKDRIISIFTFPYYNFFPMYRCGLLSKLPFNSSNNLYLGVTDPLFVGGNLGRLIGIFFGRVEIVYDMSTFMPDFLKNRVTFTCISFRPLFLLFTRKWYNVYDLEYVKQNKKIDGYICGCSLKSDIALKFILLEVKILEYLYVQIPLLDVVKSTWSLVKKILQKKDNQVVDGNGMKDFEKLEL